MFTGEYDPSIDQKGRIAIPSRLRDAFQQGAVLVRGYEKCITVYPVAQWNEMAQQYAALSVTQSKNRRFNRDFFSSAFPQDLDGQGRVLIPPKLREYASINGEVKLIGAGPYLEIWNKDEWEAVQASEDRGQVAESVEAWR